MRILKYLLVMLVLSLSACGASQTISVTPAGLDPVVPNGEELEVTKLASAILALDEGIDPAEAQRAAVIAYAYTAELKKAYGITDPPLIHNTKVNMGLRPRGLCWHWAEDMEKRLDAEGFETLEMQRAISRPNNPFRIDHSTAVISALGADMYDGIVLDPWRLGGVLTWDGVREDTRYPWRPQAEVLEEKRKKALKK